MKTLAERLKYAMETLPSNRIKGVDLARAVGVKPPSVSDWLTGKSKTMEGENLLKASKFLGVNANWLATGSGSPTDKNKQNNEEELTNLLLRNFRLNKIPLINYIQASMWNEATYIESLTLNYTYTDYLGTKPNTVFSIIVQGNSMEPEFKEGDILIVDTSLPPTPGCYVIVQNNSHEVIIRKYRVLTQDANRKEIFELVPINNDFPSLSSNHNEIRIIGIVVRHIRNLKH